MCIRDRGIKVVVDKNREIYYIDNVKFHIDTVKKLGTFVEIEALGVNEPNVAAKLTKQCKEYLNLFKIEEAALIQNSYSDMLLEIQ